MLACDWLLRAIISGALERQAQRATRVGTALRDTDILEQAIALRIEALGVREGY